MAHKRRRWFVIITVAVIAAAAVAYAAKTRGNGNGEDEKGPEIPTLAASIDDVQVVVREIGTVEPEVKVEIKSNLSGRVVDLPVRAGDEVVKGQLIARIEPDVNQAQDLLAVRSRLEAASIDVEDAKQGYEAKRKLFESGLISVEVNRGAETRYRQAQQSLDAAREKISLVEASGIPVGDNPQQVVNIRAPMDGVIIERPVELGETVTGSGSFNAGTVIATVADLGTMLVKAGINEVDIGKIHLGQPARITLDAFPRVVFTGAISRIAPAARLDNQVKVFDVEIALAELGRELRTGMTANLEIRGETRQQVLAVPIESVFVRGEEEMVYVKRETPLPKEAVDVGEGAQDEQDEAEESAESGENEAWRDDPRQQWRRWFEERTVVTGIASTTDVEIVEGLNEDEQVALADPSKPQKERS
ncbi:MAG: efflux RND transporter periplasmic adaptor subunit [Thermoanaerobaculales bacterium]